LIKTILVVSNDTKITIYVVISGNRDSDACCDFTTRSLCWLDCRWFV